MASYPNWHTADIHILNHELWHVFCELKATLWSNYVIAVLWTMLYYIESYYDETHRYCTGQGPIKIGVCTGMVIFRYPPSIPSLSWQSATRHISRYPSSKIPLSRNSVTRHISFCLTLDNHPLLTDTSWFPPSTTFLSWQSSPRRTYFDTQQLQSPSWQTNIFKYSLQLPSLDSLQLNIYISVPTLYNLIIWTVHSETQVYQYPPCPISLFW